MKYLKQCLLTMMLSMVSILSYAVTISVGGSTTLTAPSAGSSYGVLYSWTQSPAGYYVSLGSTTSQTCRVTGTSAGTSTIKCTVKWQTYNSTTKTYVYESSNVKTQTYTVTVQAVTPTSISLNYTSISLQVGETKQLSATVSPSGASQSVTWSVYSGSSYASVSSSGLVTANAAGTAIIRATSTANSSVYKDCTVTVTSSGNSSYNDGDVFTANTAEGVEMTFKVISAANKTCQVGSSYMRRAIETSSTGSITIPNKVNGFDVIKIDENAFYECSGITSVSIPSSVTSIHHTSFNECPKLASISINSGNTKYDSRNGCNAIIETASNKLIAGCKNTTIPSSVTSIGQYAFHGCSGLTNITIPSSVKSIGQWAFSGCISLKSINIPSTQTIIENGTFEGCSSLTSITIPSSVTSINYDAFNGCTGLTNITIPSTVSSIGSLAFYNCKGLTSITSKINTPFEINEDVFQYYENGTYKTIDATLYVPANKVSAYKATGGWNQFTNIVETGTNPLPTSISLNTTSVSLEVGKTIQLSATVSPSTASQSVTWSVVSGSSYASVSSSGLVTAKAAGTATIRATSTANSSIYKDCTVTVTAATLEPGTWSGNSLTIGGSATNSVHEVPYGNYYKYSTAQMLYTPTEIGKSGTISSIAFRVASSSSFATSEVKIYLGHKSGKFSSTSSYVTSSNLTLVYSGSPTLGSTTGWETLTFNQGSFTYNGTDNLVVVVTRKSTSYTDQLKYYCYSGNDYTLYRRSDETSNYGDVTTTGNYSTSTNRPAIKMTLASSTPPTSITLNDSSAYNITSLNLIVGATKRLRANVLPSDAPQSVTWSVVSGSTVASVSTSGLVTAKAAGTATVRATSTVNSSVYKDCTVTVTAAPTSISLNYTSISLTEGNTKQLTATVLPSDASQSVTWSVYSGSSYASVSSSGLVTAKLAGTAIIRATATGNSSVYKDCTVMVTESIPEPGTWSGNTLTVGGSATNSTNYVPYGNYYKYSTAQMLYSPTEIGKSGIISSLAFKVASSSSFTTSEVKVYLGHKSSKFSSTGDYVTSSNLTLVYSGSPTLGQSTGWETLTFNEGQFTYNGTDNLVVVVCRKSSSYTNSLKYYYYYTGGGYTLYRWSDGTSNYGDVTTTGNYSTSTCRPAIQMTFGGAAPTSINLNATSVNLEVGGTQQLTATVLPSDASQSVTWSVVSGSTVASVSSSGLVTANAVGTATIRATSTANSSVYKDCFVTVTEKELHDGDTFAAATVEGVEMTYTVISAANKTCLVGTNSYASAIKGNIQGSITIPEEVSGFSVTSIGNYAFNGCSGLTFVTIPNSVTSIGERAFRNCSGLTFVTIPNSVTSIGERAFQNCSGLTSITIGSGVTTIGYDAFAGCSNLASITIPESVIYMENYTFDDTPWFENQPDGLVYAGKVLYDYKGRMPEGTHIDIMEGTLAIAGFAFEKCGNLTSVTIPNSVLVIGNNVFSDGTNNITSVTIGSGVKDIGEEAFSGCRSLTTVTIPKNVESIGENAFYGCSGLTSITSEIKVPFAINKNVFQYYDDNSNTYKPLNATLYVPYGTKVLYEAASGWNQFTNIVEMEEEPNEVIEVDGLYYEIANSDEINAAIGQEVLSANVEVAVVVEAPRGHKYHGDIVIPASITYENNTYAVVAIDECAFAEYKEIELTSVVIPNSVVYIAEEAFVESSTLERVEIPNSVISIGENAFGDCEKLKSIHIPNGLSEISAKTFKNCKMLAEVEIPASVTSIGQRAFGNCNNLTTVISHINVPFDVDLSAFGIYDDNRNWIANPDATLYIPFGTKALYEAAEGWKEFTNIVEMAEFDGIYYTIDNANEINNDFGETVFTPNTEIAIVMASPHSVVYSGNIVIPSSIEQNGNTYAVEAINSQVFKEATITSVSFPSTLKLIGEQAFYKCTGLTEVVIPEGVSLLFNNSFAGCTNLTNVTLPSTLVDIGMDAFSESGGSITSVTCYLTEPFGIDKWTFGTEDASCDDNWNSYVYENAILYVPYGTKERYEATEGWNLFRNIVEMNDNDTDISMLDNVIYLEPVEARAGSTTTLSLKMKNTAAIRSFGFDLYLPEGITAVPNSSGKPWGSLNYNRVPVDDDGYPTHKMTLSYQEGNVIRFLCDAQEGQTFIGNEDEIATLRVNISETMEDGDYPVILKNVKLSETDIAQYYLTEKVKSKITILTFILGDINNDGVVDVSDYSGVADRIHGRTPAGFNEKAGDVDENGIIDVSDYSGVANLIHYGSIHGKSNSPSNAKKTNKYNVEPQ